MTARSPRRPGRPSKGPRIMMPVRLHPQLKEAVTDAAKAHGMDVNTYVSALLAADTGLTHLVSPIQQEELPNSA
ncbi:hypothetical protein [Rhodococcus artemisiae]|uniref:Toxin-antitoxin system HicB family antitoxin n=1 Tax=Rhodococcus artemisiae TaxID=714159 RepID=A0ABU7LJU0_9NOCA|nr:hypothetical protein [Rhodococcus artemisiae]MEE2061831.1 hypothetical protein [Rhodococcus artemisiae]